MLSYQSAFSSPSPSNTPSPEPSPQGSLRSVATGPDHAPPPGSDSDNGDELDDDDVFGFPLQRMAPAGRLRLMGYNAYGDSADDELDEEEDDTSTAHGAHMSASVSSASSCSSFGQRLHKKLMHMCAHLIVFI